MTPSFAINAVEEMCGDKMRECGFTIPNQQAVSYVMEHEPKFEFLLERFIFGDICPFEYADEAREIINNYFTTKQPQKRLIMH